MSELINTHDNRATIRWKLLTGASALALTAYVSYTALAHAEDADKPQIWIELGGQLDMLQGTSSTFTAPFFTYPLSRYEDNVSGGKNVIGGPENYGSKSFGQKQAPPRYAVGLDGKITFQPEDSDWSFSAAIRYGRSHGKMHTHYQGAAPVNVFTLYYQVLEIPAYAAPLSDSLTRHSERHMVLDFTAGKDVGLGLLGANGTSTVSAGVRIAQFSASSSTYISARPSVYIAAGGIFGHLHFYQYFLQGHQARSFKGIGPSISWNASAALAGNEEHGMLTLDWGISAAALFGRQKAKTDHKTSAFHAVPTYHALYPTRTYNAPLRSRNVTVPELNGFIGLSATYQDLKLSFGYKGDIWFGAVDRGIDARKTSDLTFNGPYASISFGLGD